MSRWGLTRIPAVTVGNAVGRGLIGGQGAKDNILREMAAGRWVDSPHGDSSNYGEKTRITVNDAGVLQGFPHSIIWGGTKTAGFLQIGNAAPPPVARAVLGELWT